MRALVQRVSEASVTVDGRVVGAIERGLLVLLGVTHSDGEAEAAWLAHKIAGLRIFEDEAGKFNLALFLGYCLRGFIAIRGGKVFFDSSPEPAGRSLNPGFFAALEEIEEGNLLK